MNGQQPRTRITERRLKILAAAGRGLLTQQTREPRFSYQVDPVSARQIDVTQEADRLIDAGLIGYGKPLDGIGHLRRSLVPTDAGCAALDAARRRRADQ